MITEGVAKEYGLTIQNASPLTALSSMFLHGDIVHLLGNMWFLYLFGFAVEGRVGWLRFLIVYLAAGLAGHALEMSVAAAAGDTLPRIGASGAIMGIMGAALYMFPFAQVNFFLWLFVFFRVFTWNMIWVSVYYLGFDLLGVYVGSQEVANLAHIGGALGGFLACAAFRFRRDSRDASDAKASLSETKNLGYLSALELASIARSNPTDPSIALHWAQRCQADGRGFPFECQQMFANCIPNMIQTCEVPMIAWVTAAMLHSGCKIPSGAALLVATRCEAAGDSETAANIYGSLIKEAHTKDADREASTYRLARILEFRYGDRARAIELYQTVTTRWPFGTFATEALSRLAALGIRT